MVKEAGGVGSEDAGGAGGKGGDDDNEEADDGGVPATRTRTLRPNAATAREKGRKGYGCDTSNGVGEE